MRFGLIHIAVFFSAALAEVVNADYHVGPNLGEITLEEVLVDYTPVYYVTIIGCAIIALLIWLLKVRNRQLSQSRDHMARILSEQDAVISAIPELMFEMDQDGTYLNVWARNKDELTASKLLLLHKSVYDILSSDEALKFIAALNDAAKYGQSQGVQIKQDTAGEEKWFELSVSLKDAEVEPPTFIVLSRDITESKQNQQKLKSSQERYRGLFENMADGVAIFRALDEAEDFLIIDYNHSAESIDWVNRNEMIGSKVSETYPDEKRIGLVKVLRKVWQDGVSQNFPVEYESNEGFKVWRDYFFYKLESGEVVAMYSDETARKQAEQNLKESENQKRLILETIPDLIWLKDVNGVYLSCNPVFERYIGVDESDIVGKTDFDFESEGIAETYRDYDQEVMSKGHTTVNEAWVTFADSGQRALLEVTKTSLKAWDEQLIGVLGIGHDITERHEAIEAKSLSASVFVSSHEGIIISDANNIILDANPACFELTGYTHEELIGQNPKIFSSGNQSAEFYQKMWNTIQNDGHWQGEMENRKKNGEIYTERLTIDKVLDEHGVLTHYVGVFSDITYLKQQEEELERVAYTDALTGLPNRLLLHDRMQQAFHQSERSKRMVSICYLDLDGFKPINDEFGHGAGDEVLIEVSARLKNAVRNGDTVARLGGDEFVLLILNIHSIFELEQLLKRLLTEVSKPHVLSSGNEVVVSASVGIALYPLDDADPDTLLRHSDQAMYSAKKLGKNRYSFFDATEDQRATVTHNLQAKIHQALENDEFFLQYQPKVNMKTGEVIGVEALIRWSHPEQGVVAPREFLPAIEHNILIVELGHWVLRTALMQMREWRNNGSQIKVSVNIAAMQLQRSDFVPSLQLLFEEFSDISTQDLELEILETAALHDIHHVSETMLQCEEMGIDFALDDFGTGYSSLTYLKQLPAKVLKIDQSFIRDILDDPDDIAITKGILGLAQAFHRSAIAEGVETIDHGSLLLSLGCELGQGFGIARPMPAEELPQWIENFEIEPEWRDIGVHLFTESDNSLLIMAVEHHQLVNQVLLALEKLAPSLLPDNLQDAHACKFRHWLDTEGNERYSDLEIFQDMIDQHTRLHDLCKQTEAALREGKYENLDKNKQELKSIRRYILDTLNAIRKEDEAAVNDV